VKLVRILQSIVSPQFEYQYGDEVEIDDRLAKAWAKAGVVEFLKERSGPDSPALEYPSIHGTEFAAMERPALVTRG
jgi:hypothetical protein